MAAQWNIECKIEIQNIQVIQKKLHKVIQKKSKLVIGFNKRNEQRRILLYKFKKNDYFAGHC